MRFERRYEPLLPRDRFRRRLLRFSLFAALIISGSLAVGIAGYHEFEKLPWIDALLNASMILGGMGPVDPVKTTAGKLFASFYALYSGLALVGAAGVMLAPVIHRFMHKFHIEEASRGDD